MDFWGDFSDLSSETKGFWFDSNHQLLAYFSSLQLCLSVCETSGSGRVELRNGLPLPQLSCSSEIFVKENPDRSHSFKINCSSLKSYITIVLVLKFLLLELCNFWESFFGLIVLNSV